MVGADWIRVEELATLAGIAQRRVYRAIALNRSGGNWRGVRLIIRRMPGRGGPGGLRSEVLVSSLPVALQQRWREQRAGELGAVALRDDDDANALRNFKWHVLAPALAHDFGSGERAAAIREITSRTYFFPGETTPRAISAETVRRWLRSAGRGHAGLQKAARRDRGKKHVLVSLRWDRATADFGRLIQADIADQLKLYVRGLIKAGEATAGVPLKMLAERKLWELTSQAGYGGGDLRSVCRMPRTFLEPERVYARVHQYRTDRKSYMDHAAPRGLRTRAGLMPMDIVVGDIHPVDILVRRDDGSTATFRAIAWLDLATNRVFVDLVLLEKGEGIRNAHVIASFKRMVAAWGAPRALYLDNGSEYNWAPFIDDALRLIDRASGQRLIREIGGHERLSQIIKALPYNPSGKPIEGIFAILEQNHLSAIDGWIGGDRMRKKTANVGQEPEPFAGSAAECAALVHSMIDFYHNVPQRGALNGRSPYGALADAIASGWSMTAVDDDTFAVAFSELTTRTVKQGRIQHGGRFWTCPELDVCQTDKVLVRVPKYEDWTRLPLFAESGELLGFAELQTAYGFRDQVGARDAHRRRKAHKAAVIALDRSAPNVDRVAARQRFVSLMPPAPVAPSGATVGASEEAKRIADDRRETPKQRADRRQQEIDDEQRESLRLDERRKQRRHALPREGIDAAAAIDARARAGSG